MISGTTRRNFRNIIYDTSTGEIEEVYQSSDRHEEAEKDTDPVVIDIEIIEAEVAEYDLKSVNEDPAIYNKKGKLVTIKNQSNLSKKI